MKIEKISDNQIKCTLNRSDLASRQIKLSELAYGTEKAKSLFQDMMEQANVEFGFDAADFPLMIEAIPVSMDCIVLMITKVENPDEVDTKFSNLANVKNFYNDEEEDPDWSPEFTLEQQINNLAAAVPEIAALTKKALEHKNTSDRLYSFKELETVIDFAHQVKDVFAGKSSLYKCAADNRYYLFLQRGGESSAAFENICNTALEYGKNEPASYARAAYINEHFNQLIQGDAIQNLGTI